MGAVFVAERISIATLFSRLAPNHVSAPSDISSGWMLRSTVVECFCCCGPFGSRRVVLVMIVDFFAHPHDSSDSGIDSKHFERNLSRPGRVNLSPFGGILSVGMMGIRIP
jgi:hypothetical protein